MKAQFRILSGSRAGQVEVHSRNEIAVGRHPSCEMRFDPEHDLDVSTRHAMILRTARGWSVRDLQSRNGTFVNGHRITADTSLSETDQVRFGSDGPNVEYRAVPDSVADTAPAVFAAGATVRPSSAGRPTAPTPGGAPTPGAAPAPPARRAASATQRIQVEVARQTRRMRMVTAGLTVVLLGAIGGFWFYNRMADTRREAEVAEVRNRTDEALRAFQAQLQGLTSALQNSQQEVRRLQTELASARASGDQGQVAQLSRRLDDASNALRNQQAAAQVDYRAIHAANQRATAIVYAKFADDRVFTGTAFAVRSSGLLVTNRHVVAGVDGRNRAVDLALKFADSYQVFKASIVRVSAEADLAIVKVENLVDTIPVVRGINTRAETVQPGDPVGMIGFPLGVDLPMGEQAGKQIAKTTFGPGTVSKVLPDRIQIDGYSATGASGSPIFDREGAVVGVLYGGQEGTGGRVLYAIPATFVARLIQSIN